MLIKIVSIFILLFLFFYENALANTIKAIRWSDNEKDTRLVIETLNNPVYNLSFVSNKILKIEFPKISYHKLNFSKNLNNHPRNIKNLVVSNKKGQTEIIITLRNKVKVKDFVLENTHHKYYRLVIDIKESNTTNKIVSKASVKLNKQNITIERVDLIKKDEVAVPEPIVYEPTKPKLKQLPIILIDPGHGGKDVGATGNDLGIFEKNVTLKYAMTLKRNLESKKKYKVFITRTRDEFIPLSKRLEKISHLKADLFISIHADSHPDRKLRGLSIYTLSDKASDKEAENLAKHENDYNILSDIDIDKSHEEVSDLILDMIYQKKQNYAMLFAEIVVKELQKYTKLLNHSHRYANFKVLKSRHVPSVLIELGYLSNEEEEKLLVNEAYKKKITTALTNSIDHFFNNYHKK